MQQSQYRRQHKVHDCQRRLFLRFVLTKNVSLGRFNKPVAIIAPNKIVEALRDYIELIFAVCSLDCVDCLVQARQHFDGKDRQRLSIDFWRGIARTMHLTKARDIPKLRREVTAFFDLFLVEANVLACGRDAHQTKPQAVGAVFVDQLERIGRIAERLRHFATQLVANNAGEENVVKRDVVFSLAGFARLELEAGDDHPCDPEENNVRRSYEHTGWIKFPSRFLIHRLIRPEPRRKPGVERVFILNPVPGIRRRFDADVNFPSDLGFGIWDLRFPVPCRYPVPPPYLSADAPIADVLQPLGVHLLPVRWKKADKMMITHYGERLFRFWVAQKPLLADTRLDWHVATIAEPDIVLVWLHFRQRSPCLQ